MTGPQRDPREREEIERNLFEDRLRHFVREWAPDNDRDRYEMQLQLSMLLRDAMRSQTAFISAEIDRYTSTILREASLRPLAVIFDKPESKKP
jgi:hypothetical protein